MPKLLIFADIHVHLHKKSSDRLSDCLEALEWIFKTALEKNVDNIVFIGDLFQTRQKIDVLTYQRTFEIFQKYQKDVKSWLLLGNHDMWYSESWDVSSVLPLGAIQNVNVINRPCTIEIDGFPISFLPYTKNPIQSLQEIQNSHPFKLLFAHVAIDGALWNTKYDTYSEVIIEHDGDMVKVDSGVFKGWNQVFLGHYHAAQLLAKHIEYVGSPLQLTYGEAFQDKHIILYDTDTKQKEYIQNDFSPKHFVIPPDKLDTIKLGERDFLTIEATSLTSPENLEIKKEVEKYNLSEVKIRAKKKIQETQAVIEDAKAILQDENQMAEKYIDQVGTKGLERGQLLEIFNFVRSKLDEGQS